MVDKILLIEDDPPTIEIYEEVLRRAGFEVEVIMLGKDAIKRMEKMKKGGNDSPDLILLDLILPDMSGSEILKYLKNNEKLKSIPLFVLTNYSDPELKKESLKLEVEGYIMKTDFTPSELVRAIKERIAKK